MLLLAMAALLAGGSETVPTVSAKTGDVEIIARLLADKQAVISSVGSDLQRQYVVVELTVTPRGGYPVTLNREDFLLRSERDNERATADSPDRVAGGAVLVLGGTGGARRAYSEAGDPVFTGGLPGVGIDGRPRRIGAQDNTYGGGGEAGDSTVTAAKKEETPLLSALKQKELPLGETRKPVKGYLYFSVDPQQKAKNFHLHYKGPRESCEMRFK